MRSQYPVKSVGDVLILQYGKPLPESERVSEGGVPAYGANGVLCRSRQAFRTKPSIIVGRKGSAGEISLADGPFWPTDVTYFVEHDEQASDLRYLFYTLKVLNLQKLAKGVKPGINRNDVYTLSIPFPPLPEQKRIVAILDEAFREIDTAVANAEKNLANARELFKTELSAVFERGGEGWLEGSLGNFVTIKHGYAFESQFFRDAGTYTLLTPGNFFEAGGYRFRGAKQRYYDGSIPEGFILSSGDVLVAMTEQAAGLLGSSMIVPAEGKFLHNQRLGLVKPRTGVPWVPELFEHLFNTKTFRQQVHQESTGVKVRHTSPDKLGAVPIRIPNTVDEQRRLAGRLSAIRESTIQLEDVQNTKIELLAELRRAILQTAFSGHLTQTTAIAA